MQWFSGSVAWLMFGFVLLMLETVLPGVFVMWWGLAAILVAGLVFLLPDVVFAWQAVIFAVVATSFSLIWWRVQHNKDKQNDAQSELNQRDHAMIGNHGVVVELLSNGIARVKCGDTTWRAKGEQLNIGDSVMIKQVDGITLMVEKSL